MNYENVFKDHLDTPEYIESAIFQKYFYTRSRLLYNIKNNVFEKDYTSSTLIWNITNMITITYLNI